MLLILEALFVGFYCLLLYTIISPVLSHYRLWFIIGFIKHFMAFYIGLHDYYCNNGDACHDKGNKKALDTYIILDSVLEGIFFIIIGSSFIPLFTNKYVATFFAGFVIHILAELSGLHKYFCKYRCI